MATVKRTAIAGGYFIELGNKDIEIYSIASDGSGALKRVDDIQGTQSAKTRGEVRGGGRKIYRQKGTGNARHHGNRAPQFTHGGVVFAPKPRDYYIAVPKKVRRLAFKSAMTSKLNAGEIMIVDEINLAEGKTKLMAKVLKNLKAEKKALVVLPEREENVVRATANLAEAATTYVNTLNVYDILNANKLILTKAALALVEEVYA